jgi:hypothetical protein
MFCSAMLARHLWLLTLKGTVSPDWYFFWGSKHFNQYRRYFRCMRWWFSRSFKSFSLPLINFLFASLKLLTNFENDYY